MVSSGVRRKFSSGGVLVQGHMVVTCIWCALFMTSQFDAISMFPNQRFGEVCWHNMHIFLHPLPYFMCHCIEYKLSALEVRLSEKKTQRYDTVVHNCKNIRLRVETGEWNTLIPTSEQFTTAKWDCAKVSSNTSSWALKVCGWTGWRTPWFARLNFTKLHENWECA